jgi:hypothetical protein
VDPDVDLYPLLASWPTPSPSGETILVRPDGADVIYINKLRFPDGNGTMFRKIPLADTNVISVRAIRKLANVHKGLDYRGRRVLAAAYPVPESSWTVISKQDEDEVMKSLRRQALLAEAALVLLIEFVWISAKLIGRRELFVLRETERLRSSLASSLSSLRHLDGIVQDSPVLAFRWRDAERQEPEYVSGNVRRLGFTPSALFAQAPAFMNMVAEPDRERLGRLTQDAFRSGTDSFTTTYAMIAASGQVYHVQEFSSISHDDGGHTCLKAMILIMTDSQDA